MADEVDTSDSDDRASSVAEKTEAKQVVQYVSEEVSAALNSYLDSLSDQELIEVVDNFEHDVRRVQLENYIFEEFLKVNEPSLLVAPVKKRKVSVRASASTIQSISSPSESDSSGRSSAGIQARAEGETSKVESKAAVYSEATTVEEEGSKDDSSGTRAQSVTSKTTSTGTPERRRHAAFGADKGPRVNLSMKTDLVMRNVENLQKVLEAFVRKSHNKKAALKAETEEVELRMSEVAESLNLFEESVVIEGVDPMTQRIPAEKFVRFMNDWLRSAQITVDKMRLRLGTSKIKLAKLKVYLKQKKELRANIHEVDFDKITIENGHLKERLEQKNHHLLELKRMNGSANLVLTTHKNFLAGQIEELKRIIRKVSNTEKQIDLLDEDEQATGNQLDKEEAKLAAVKHLVDNYRVPDVLEYVKCKNELEEVKRTLKVWKRRLNIQTITYKRQRNKMAKLVGKGAADWVMQRIKRNERLSDDDLFYSKEEEGGGEEDEDYIYWK